MRVKYETKGAKKLSARENTRVHDLFIIYYRKTGGDLAKFLKSGLEENAFPTFLDVSDIPKVVKDASDEWRNYRDRALLNSDKIILIMTHGFVGRKEVLHEIGLAMKNDIEIIYFKHENMPYDIKINIDNKEINLSNYELNSFYNENDLLRKALSILTSSEQIKVAEDNFDNTIHYLENSEGLNVRSQLGPKIEIIVGSTNKIVNWLPPNSENKRIVSFEPSYSTRVIPNREYYEFVKDSPKEFLRVHVNGTFHIIKTLEEIRGKENLYFVGRLMWIIIENLIYCIRVMKAKEISHNQSVYINLINMSNKVFTFSARIPGVYTYSFPKDKEIYRKQFNPNDKWSTLKNLFMSIYRDIVTDLGIVEISDSAIEQTVASLIEDMRYVRTTLQGETMILRIDLDEFEFRGRVEKV